MSVKPIHSYRKFWAECLGPAPVLPMSREEMDRLGWDCCDAIIITGDAYVDHPSFGMAVIGRVLEAHGFRVGIIAQPTSGDTTDFMQLGAPGLFFGITAGNMDSMINRYTADRKVRRDDAYTPGNVSGKRPDRAVTIYSQRCREAYGDVPIVIGGIEASLRRIAHYDYWDDRVHRSVLFDAGADLLLFGNAERAIVEVAHRLADGIPIGSIDDIRGTAFVRRTPTKGFREIDSTKVDRPGRAEPKANPYAELPPGTPCATGEGATADAPQKVQLLDLTARHSGPTVVRLPAFEAVRDDPVLYAHASRTLHLETNPGNARPLVQRHDKRDLWLNPPPVPLTTDELDWVFEQPYTRRPHPRYGNTHIPAYEMIRFSVNIMRGCFGGCTFCSITEHEGRIIQNRSKDSIVREIESICDHTPGFTGIISDLGGPTANMWRLGCKDPKVERTCRRLSCVYPGICKNLNTDQTPLVDLYRSARQINGVKKVLIASGLRYDLAVETPEYVKELVTHHVGGYLKIAPEHTEGGPLSKMMKPGIGSYDRFKALFEQYSREAGKQQYLIPYFIAGHPGSSDEDMINLALWLKRNGFRADQVQTFYPSPMALATAMYHSGWLPLHKVSRKHGERVWSAKGLKQRRLHKAFLRYHDPENWPLLRDALKQMGRTDLIGNGGQHLVPRIQPRNAAQARQLSRPILTQHTGLPPRGDRPPRKRARRRR